MGCQIDNLHRRRDERLRKSFRQDMPQMLLMREGDGGVSGAPHGSDGE
jgi:hypothetical protein